MEAAPKFEGESTYNREQVAEDAMEKALDAIEAKLDKNFEDASSEERVAVTTELLSEIEARNDNADRHIAEIYARLRRLAELELSFKVEHEKLNRVLH